MRDWGSSCHMILIVVFSSLIVASGIMGMNFIAFFFSAILIAFLSLIAESNKCQNCERNCNTCKYQDEYIKNHPEEFEEEDLDNDYY
jgi:hypothetical protein